MATSANEILINGRAYSWADISVVLLGRKVQGISAINFEQMQDKQNNFGQGDRAVSRSRGNVTTNASITLSQKEVVAIENALPAGKTLLDIKPFSIIVAFNNDENQFVSYELQHAEFTRTGIGANQGDALIEQELPLIISQVKRVA